MYSGISNPRKTPQTKPIPGRSMVKMESGGYAFGIDKWTALDRFLILGPMGSFYINAKRDTEGMINVVTACIQEDGKRVVDRIVEVSDKSLAPQRDHAVFAWALCMLAKDEETRKLASDALLYVAPYASPMLMSASELKNLRGFGSLVKQAYTRWYAERSESGVAYQVVKYRNRYGFTHTDILRLVHPRPGSELMNKIFGWIVGKTDWREFEDTKAKIIWAYEMAKESKAIAIKMIREHSLPWEAVPSEYLKDKGIWEELLPHMPIVALVRNLGRMSSLGMFDMTTDEDYVANKIMEVGPKIHPLNILIATKTYASGRGFRGSLTWPTSYKILEALGNAFESSFGNLQPTGKKRLIGIDSSGSMDHPISTGIDRYGNPVNGPITCREAAVVLSLCVARTEENYRILAFTCGNDVRTIPITKTTSIAGAVEILNRYMKPNGTDCSLPIRYAQGHNWGMDSVEIYTDAQSWAGPTHNQQALDEYRRRYGDTRYVEAQMVYNRYSTISVDEDPYSLLCVGYSRDTPSVVSGFVRGFDEYTPNDREIG